MITVNTKNLYEGGAFDAESGNYKLSGDFRKNPVTGKVTTMNASFNVGGDDEGGYIGSVNAYLEGEELKYNLNSISISHLVAVAGLASELVNELEK